MMHDTRSDPRETPRAYDPLNRRTKVTFQDGTSTNYTYDAGNRITQVQEKDASNVVTATITRTYDGLDRLTQEVTAEGTVNYTYDNASRRTTMTVVGQTQVVYTYDNANRLTTITQGTSTVTIGYDDADRRTSVTYPNTNSITYAYNVASELTTLTYKQGATTLGTLTYTYDAAGNRIKTGGTFARSNLPPALSTATYNANNQQTVFGTTTETYDLNGNLSTTADAGVTTTYTWNARNQLTGISRTGLTASFTYDSFGRRTVKTVNGTATDFVYDGLNPVQEKTGATVNANLLTGLGIDEFFTRTDSVGVRSLLPDALGSTIALGDNTGTIQTQYTYEPFGITTQTGAASTSSYKYTGREDDGSGLSYYRARYYQPRLQRFISEDPIGYGGGTNFYAYVMNNPMKLVDPLGLICQWYWGGRDTEYSEQTKTAIIAEWQFAAPTGVSPGLGSDTDSLNRKKPRPPLTPQLQFEWWMFQATLKNTVVTGIWRDVTHYFYDCEEEIRGPCGEKTMLHYSGHFDAVRETRKVLDNSYDLITRRLYRIGSGGGIP
jgi:RHS repeat-associated protein